MTESTSLPAAANPPIARSAAPPMPRPLVNRPVVARYPRRKLYGEVALGAGGLVVLSALMIASASWPAAIILGPMAFLFAVYLLLMLRRLGQSIEADAMGIRVNGRPRLVWEELGSLRLRYYATRRQRTDGWFVLTVTARRLAGGKSQGGGRITLESSLEGFEPIVAHAAAEAVARGVALDEITVDNLLALDVHLPYEEAADGERTAGATRGKRP